VRLFLTYKDCATTLFATSVEIAGYEASAWRSLTELRGAIGEVLRTSAPGDAGVLLAGLVTGDDTGLSDDRAGAFIRTGTTHLTAVSGSNLALVAGMLATTGTLTVGRHRVVWQFLTLAGIWGYALISGAQSPVVRAALVASAAVLAFRVGRRPDFVTLILLAAGIMVVVEPQQVEALGYRLSVASSLALAVIVPPLLKDDRAPLPAVALMATVAAQIATLPLLLPVFGVVSLTSLPANIAAAPLAAVAMPLAALAAVTGLVWQPLGELIAAPASLVATILLEIVDRLGAPYATVEIGAPTTAVAVVIAATAAAVLLLVSVLPRK
jgi:competence protein ComEC